MQGQQDGISLVKAINLAKNNQFTPQRVQFEAYTTNRVFGDEPEITFDNFNIYAKEVEAK